MMESAIAEAAFGAAFREAARQAVHAAPDERGLRPRGIIIPAGGARMFTCAWVAVRMLREVLKTTLPIQIWHLGPQEMSPAMAALMAEQQVETVDALAMAALGDTELGGFELKSFALLYCAFRHVVMLDADNVPLIDPEELFDDPAFISTGALFWPDLISIAASSPIWEMSGVAYRNMPSFESGQMAVDRTRCFSGLSLAWFLNSHSKIVYQHIYGDKDTFLIAWLALGLAFHLVPHPVKRLQGCLLQHHPDGRRMFQHRNLRKWKLHGGNSPIDGFLEEERCLRFLDELRQRWTGRILLPPPLDDELHSLAEELSAARFFTLETVSIGTEALEFLQSNLLRRSRGAVANWWLDRIDGKPVLMIGEDAVISRRFLSHAPGYWRSQAPGAEEQDMVLTPSSSPRAKSHGHNSDSTSTTLTNWMRNYVRPPTGTAT